MRWWRDRKAAQWKSRNTGSTKGNTMVAIGKDYVAVLSTNQRGPVERGKAGTRLQAFAAARTLLDVAERREWHRGEAISVEVRQAEE
jgi:hypothetical protein